MKRFRNNKECKKTVLLLLLEKNTLLVYIENISRHNVGFIHKNHEAKILRQSSEECLILE